MRVNAAADLVEAGVPVAEAARAGRAEIPQDTVVFTVKLPAGLAGRVRAHARRAGLTISAVVTQALEEFLARGHGNHPRR